MQNSVKAQREAAGMSRSALANHMQVDWSTVWRWEEGRVTVPWSAIVKIAEILKVRPVDLVPDMAVLATPTGEHVNA